MSPSDEFTFRVLLLHAGVTWLLVGLIWFVQVVHYPLFASVGEDQSAGYAAQHQRLTGFVVIVPMLLELSLAALLVLRATPGERLLPIVGLSLLAIIWLSTFLLQVPCHRQLLEGAGVEVVDRLVATNWIRTVSWSLRGVLALWMLSSCMADRQLTGG